METHSDNVLSFPDKLSANGSIPDSCGAYNTEANLSSVTPELYHLGLSLQIGRLHAIKSKATDYLPFDLYTNQ